MDYRPTRWWCPSSLPQCALVRNQAARYDGWRRSRSLPTFGQCEREDNWVVVAWTADWSSLLPSDCGCWRQSPPVRTTFLDWNLLLPKHNQLWLSMWGVEGILLNATTLVVTTLEPTSNTLINTSSRGITTTVQGYIVEHFKHRPTFRPECLNSHSQVTFKPTLLGSWHDTNYTSNVGNLHLWSTRLSMLTRSKHHSTILANEFA